MARKTIEELEAAARAAEERAKKLRAKAKKQTQAEEAKLNAEIIKALEGWRTSFPTHMAREDLPDRFRAWAQKNREKYNSGCDTKA
jgi:hypothetical protein